MSHAALPTALIPDMAWCWWTRPRATRIGDAVFFAALDSEGGMVVARHDLATKTTERARLAAFEDDDHNNPAVIAQPGKPLVCFYSRHDAEEGLRYRISRRPLDLGAWEPEQILTFGGSTTYGSGVADDQTIAAVDQKWDSLGLGDFIPSPSLSFREQLYGTEAVADV